MTEATIQYDKLVQNALLKVVADLLTETAKNGLIGEHHFYITFSTQDEGVIIPNHLKEKYPDDMTIVLQNQFWDLKVEDDFFEISLSFNRVKELLHIPFNALLGFLDPSVNFGLHFHAEEDELITEEEFIETTAETEKTAEDIQKSENGENIVSLDHFRKK